MNESYAAFRLRHIMQCRVHGICYFLGVRHLSTMNVPVCSPSYPSRIGHGYCQCNSAVTAGSRKNLVQKIRCKGGDKIPKK